MPPPKERPKPPKKFQHLDEFPDEADQIAWERAVLERARAAGLFTSGRLNAKEELFWQKLKAYEAREISKRRQRSKPSRLERFDELAESRVERGIRQGLVSEDEMKCENRMARRAERFGIQNHTGADGVLQGGVLDWMTDEQRLKMRRERFEKEPRDDEFYRKEWVSESGADEGFMSEQRMAARRRRFSEGDACKKSGKVKDGDRMNVEMDGQCRSGSDALESIQERDPFARFGSISEAEKATKMEEDGQVLQEWERMCESWGPPDDDQGEKSIPDKVEVNAITDVAEGVRVMPLTKENLLSLNARDESDGKVLQSWEAGGEEW